MRRLLFVCVAASACSSGPRRLPQPSIDPMAREAADNLSIPTDSIERATLNRELQNLLNSARAELASDRAVEAGEYVDRALAIDPTSSEALRIRGAVSWKQSSWRQAALAWERVSPSDPELGRLATIARLRHLRELLAEVTPQDAPLPQLENPLPQHSFTLRAVGDIHLGEAWPENRVNLPPDDARPLFARTRDLLRTADITFANVETVIADSGESTKCRPRSTACYAFRVPASFARTLSEAGIDLASTNNNHASDFGEFGQTETARNLREAGIEVAGPLGVARWQTDSLTFAMAAFSTGGGDYRVQEIGAAAAVVRELDREVDVVIVSFHGGAEGEGARHLPRAPETAYGEDRGDVWAFARSMVDHGADLVLGHGPHILRAMEVYRGRFIAYSLGNFTTWNTFGIAGARGLSTVLDLRLSVNGAVINAALLPLRLRESGVPTPDPTSEAIAEIRMLSSEDLGSALFDERGEWTWR